MKQFVIMNKENGSLGLGIRVLLCDNAYTQEIESLGGYSIQLRSNNDYDGWLLFTGADDAEGPWMWINRSVCENKIEVLSEL